MVLNHCDYKDMQKSRNKVKIIEKVLFIALLVFGDYNCQKLILTLYNFQLRSLGYGFPCINQISYSNFRALATMPHFFAPVYHLEIHTHKINIEQRNA